MSHIFFEITTVTILAAALGAVAGWLRQPTIMGYIATGIIVGPLGLLRLDNPEVLNAMAEIGIAFLLFLVGMEMRFDDLKHVGKTALATGICQIVFTSCGGFLIARLLGFATLPALYMAVALTFSSTIIVVKILSEKRALESLYGKIVIGFLLVQDFVALAFLILLSALARAGGDFSALPWNVIGLTFAKAAALLGLALLAGRFVMPRLLRSVGHVQETLFLVSLAWGLGLAALASAPFMGLTIEIGAFIAGLALAGNFERHQISSRIKSLRDFFIVMFFIVLGSKMAFGDLRAVAVPAAVLSLFVLVGNPLIVMATMGALGQSARVSFLSSVTVAQISEFSLIIMAVGLKLGHVAQHAVTLVTTVGIVTIAVSSYMILYSDGLYRLLRKPLKIFEFRRKRPARFASHALSDHIVLIGCHRMGHNILDALEELHKDFVVVDFNPDVVARLEKRGLRAVYGDVSDPDIFETAGLDRARLVISTVPTVRDSRQLLQRLARVNPSAHAVMTADTEAEAIDLYEAGAEYVLLPHFIGGLQLARAIQQDGSLGSLRAMRERDLEVLVNAA